MLYFIISMGSQSQKNHSVKILANWRFVQCASCEKDTIVVETCNNSRSDKEDK